MPRPPPDRNFSVFAFGAADLGAGIGLIAGRWQLTYTEVWRTREFRAVRSTWSHFGSLTLSRAY